MTARHRLSRKEVAALPTTLTEAQFQRQVTELAELYGWSWAHFRPAMTSKGWRTPVSGPLGAGWPDLVLAKPAGTGHGNWTTTWLGGVLFVELKRDGGKPTPEQDQVLATLGGAGARVHVWRPSDWPSIQETLSERRAA